MSSLCYLKEDVLQGKVPLAYFYTPPRPPRSWGYFKSDYINHNRKGEINYDPNSRINPKKIDPESISSDEENVYN